MSSLNSDKVASRPVEITMNTPQIPTMPALPPKPEISISTLEPEVLECISGIKPKTNLTAHGKPLTKAANHYDDGVGVFDNTTIAYKIPGGYNRFVAMVGIDGTQKHSIPGALISNYRKAIAKSDW